MRLAGRAAFAVALAIPCFAQAPLVKGAGNFIHDVANLDQSVHFYRDVLGMEMQRPPGDWQTTEGVLKMYGAVGGRFRVATAQVTGVAMRVELVEFQGVDRKPVRRAIGEPGASLLILTTPDLPAALARLKAANWPLAGKLTEECNGRGAAVADPDGFPVLLVQPRAEASAPSGKNFTGLRFGYTVSSGAALAGPMRALGLVAVRGARPCRPVEEALLNAGSSTLVKLPDGFEILLVPSNRGKRSAGRARPQDPGAAVLRLAVTDAKAAVEALNKAGVRVTAQDGAIQTLPPAGGDPGRARQSVHPGGAVTPVEDATTGFTVLQATIRFLRYGYPRGPLPHSRGSVERRRAKGC